MLTLAIVVVGVGVVVGVRAICQYERSERQRYAHQAWLQHNQLPLYQVNSGESALYSCHPSLYAGSTLVVDEPDMQEDDPMMDLVSL